MQTFRLLRFIYLSMVQQHQLRHLVNSYGGRCRKQAQLSIKLKECLCPPEGSTVYPGISFDCVTDANKDKASAIGLALQNAGVLDKPVHALRGNREDGGIG